MQHIKSEDSAAKGNWSNNCKSDSLDNLDLLLSGIEIKEEPFSPKEQYRDACRVSQVVHDIPANFQQPLNNKVIKQDAPSKTLNNMKTTTQIVSEKVKISYSDLKKEKETPNLCPATTLEKCRTQTLATVKTSHWSSKDIEPLRITFDIGPLISTSKFGMLEIRAQLVSKIFGSKLFDHPTGLTVTEDGLLIVADTGNNVVKVLQDSSILFTIGEKDGVIFARPSAVVVDNQGHIYVKDDYCIQVFDIRGRLLHCIGRNTFLHPYGLALIKEGKNPTLVVIDAGRGGSIVHHYLIKENKLITYPYKPLLRFGSKTSKVRFMAISGDIMLASDLGASQMYLSRTNGECLTTFSNYGTRPGEIHEPSGIAVDAAGNWIVGDSKNNRIQVFTLDGSFIGSVRLSHPIRRPSGLHLTSDGHLYVINYLDNEIAVFKLLK
ncbi:unnamed protein product [Lymnaea stagnalis]|uniref:Uncharacterized protein n=1 Tax=Lymnaea stagnalis TaxID=6523 RepID=A0AAV2HDU1_LYMST